MCFPVSIVHNFYYIMIIIGKLYYSVTKQGLV